MKTKDSLLLERAYLSINQKLPSVPSDDIDLDKDLDDPSSEHVLDKEQDLIASDDISSFNNDNKEDEQLGSLAPKEALPVVSLPNYCDEDGHDINVDNLNSIRESITKIAMICSQGGNLEPWQQTKIAIAMDNLAEVARRIKF